MEQHHFDIAIIGGGPGGYPAAIRAAQKGLSVALIEANLLGGTCLNVGCIPTKTLIASAKVLHQVKAAANFGITFDNLAFDYGKMVWRKDQVITKVREGLKTLIESNQITLIQGYGKLTSPHHIRVTGQDSGIISAKNVILATGSSPLELPNFPCDYKRVHQSTSLLEQKVLPKHLVIIGGGVIGCEFASLYAELGVKVTILEALPQILPLESKKISEALAFAFKEKGVVIQTSVRVEGIKHLEDHVKVIMADGEAFEADSVLVSVGRKLNTENLGLEKAGVLVNEKGVVETGSSQQTNVTGVYAIGDITGKWQLAHAATHQGIIAVENILGNACSMNEGAVPSVVFTNPEIATVGLSLQQALDKGFSAVEGAFPFQALGKSQATGKTGGFAQIVIDKNSGQVLGAQVVGEEASTLIAEMGIIISNELTVESITETVYAHPTIAEAWLEAALLANNEPLHLPPKIKAKK